MELHDPDNADNEQFKRQLEEQIENDEQRFTAGEKVRQGIYISLFIHYYHRFIVRFPIGLDFPLITLPFQGC